MSLLKNNILKTVGVAALAALFVLPAMADGFAYQFRMHEQGVQAQPTNEDIWARWFADLGYENVDFVNPPSLFYRNITAIPSVPYPASSVKNFDLGDNHLANVDGLSSLTSVEGDIRLQNSNLTKVDGLSNLTSVGGILNLTTNNLTNVNGLSNLKSAGSLYLSNNHLANVDSLSSLTSVGDNLSLDNNNLTNVDGLSNLTSVGYLGLDYNHFTNVDGLSSLTSVKLGLSLVVNSNLTDLSGLRNVKYLGKVIRLDSGIQNRTGFVPIPASAWLCQPGQSDLFGKRNAQQSDVCASN